MQIPNIQETTLDYLTSSEEIKKDKSYQLISYLLTEMSHNGFLSLGAGYCISMSDMIRIGLKQHGIESRLVEVQLSLNFYGARDEHVFVGFDHMKTPGQIDTHVVIVTETDTPFLIDASLSHILPRRFPAVIEPIYKIETDIDGKKILVNSDFTDQNIKAIYVEKNRSNLPQLYQRSILERIETDHKIFKKLSNLKLVLMVLITIVGLNAVRGAYDFYNVYHVENNWGPRTLEEISKRLEELEHKLND